MRSARIVIPNLAVRNKQSAEFDSFPVPAVHVCHHESQVFSEMPGQQEVIEILKEKGIRDTFKVIIGGAPTSQDWADLIGADLYCENANAAPDRMEKIIKNKN